MIRPPAIARASVPGSRLAAWLVLSLCLAAAAVVLRDLLSLSSLLRRPAQCELDNEVPLARLLCSVATEPDPTVMKLMMSTVTAGL